MTRRHANCPACHRRLRVGPELGYVTTEDVFPQHADITNGGWCDGSLWLVEQEDYTSEAP